MSRPGVSYLDIANAAIKLVEKNIRPSIEEVRKELGTGSNSTINRHLRQWWEKQGRQMEAQQGLPDTLLIAVKGIYDAIQEEAVQKINAATAENTEMISRLTNQIAQLKTDNSKLAQHQSVLENQFNECQHRESTLQKKLSELSQDFDKKNIENTSQQDRIRDKENEIERLTQQLNHAHHNLDHYRDSMRQQREIETQQYDKALNKLEQELQQQRVIATEGQAQLVKLKQQHESLKQHNRHCEEKLEESLEKWHKQELALQRQEINHNNLLQQHAQLDVQHKALLEESKSDKNSSTVLKTKLEKANERIEELNIALIKYEDRVNMLNDKNIFLIQEKTELASQLKFIHT